MKQQPLPRVEHFSVLPLAVEGETRGLTQKVFSTKRGSPLVAIENYGIPISAVLEGAYGKNRYWGNEIHHFKLHSRVQNGEWVSVWVQLKKLEQTKPRIFAAQFLVEIVRCKDDILAASGDFSCHIFLRR